MKKIAVLLVSLLIITSGAFAQVNLTKVKDGVYFAESNTFSSSGWKAQIILTVSKGKIVDATWNGVSNIAGAADKKSYAAAGKYGMVKASKIKAEWDVQAKAVEDYLVKTQDINFAKMDANGHPDGISGASLSVSEFFSLAKEALAAEPVAKGSYKDGWYYKEGDKFENGWKDSVLITVVNGTIVDVVLNGIPSDAAKKSKILESVAGNYKMNAKNGEWYVQAERIEKAIVKAGNPSKVAVGKDGKTDAISGVSITVGGFINLALEALKAAK
ncbi:MAG: FMN-binding protein [Spirochaetaceae bacterium]|nr:FMN-binding protein [Spirochaetaceae bacterium]